MERVKNYVIIALVVLCTVFLGLTLKSIKDLSHAQNQLTSKDAQIQQLDTDLGLSKSELVEVDTLNHQYKNEIDGFPDKLKSIIKEYKLKIQSRDQTIAALNGKIQGGNTTVIVEKPLGSQPADPTAQVIRYEWHSKDNRFHLLDPDIFAKDNEEFTYNQFVSMKGYVYQGKDGKLQIRKVDIQEVIPYTNEAGHTEYKPIDGPPIKIVDSNFQYTNSSSKDKSLLDVITLRSFASFDTSLNPGIGVEWANLGRVFDYWNLGVNSKIVADVSDPLKGSLQKSRLDVGLDYQIIPPFLDTNLAVGISVGTPFDHFGSTDNLVLSGNAIFYITNDYNPFQK